MSEGSLFFQGQGSVQQTLKSLAARLDSLQIPYAIVEGMALFQHGYRRFTEDVDVLVTSEGLKQIHEALDGKGYLPPFAGSRNLRDVETGVRIEFLTTGGFPGDGRPKPVAFPPPDEASEDHGGIRYLTLPRLIELKLASGMSSPGRLKDLADIQELIRALNLARDFSCELHPSVANRFRELWDDCRADGA